MVRIHPDQAAAHNARGYGIFHTVNEFQGPRRIQNLTRINAWAVDIDDGTKDDQLQRIRQGLIPTLVVESKRGYHVYWAAKDARKEHWNAIVADRLIPFYGADPRARDLARILRMPNYLHLKDPTDPFLVRKVWEWKVAYTEMQMAMFYPTAQVQKPELKIPTQARGIQSASGGFWEKVWNLDCEEALGRMSGSPAVGGESYSFRPNANGAKNIFVNDKSTSCWIDRDGRIGSLDGGGPTIYQWLGWFHKNPKRVVELIKEFYPELRTL